MTGESSTGLEGTTIVVGVSNVQRGNLFEAEVAGALAQFGWRLQPGVALGIGHPPKRHRFDLADPSSKVAVECKAFTWTESGNIPSAKVTTAREAVFFLQWLEEDWIKMLAMSRSLRAGSSESLAEYFVRLNGHLLGTVTVVEVADGQVRVLHGRLAL
jgi:hypothetical protein